MYLIHERVSKTIPANHEIYNHILVSMFYKRYVYPFPVAQILNPYHADFNLYCVYVCRHGAILCFFLLCYFFRIQSKTPILIIFLPNKQKWINILKDANVFKEAVKDKPVYQWTHTTAAKLRDGCFFCYLELILFVCNDVLQS